MLEESLKPNPYAHSNRHFAGQLLPEDYMEQFWHYINVHSRRVAELAHDFTLRSTRSSNMATHARFAGLLHDIGKVRPKFRYRLSGFPEDQGFYTLQEISHKGVGAAVAAESNFFDISMAIQGHHGGLINAEDLTTKIVSSNARKTWLKYKDYILGLMPEIPDVLKALKAINIKDDIASEMSIRMLFSCLVDADWLDSDDYFKSTKNNGHIYDPTLPYQYNILDANLCQQFIDNICIYADMRYAEGEKEKYNKEILISRKELFEEARSLDFSDERIFGIEAPTGMGKTLSSLVLALRIAKSYRLERIIYVAPYITLVNQNAKVISTAIGETEEFQYVLPHHSQSEWPEDKQRENDSTVAFLIRISENWNHPFIATTSVQCLESLLHNKPSRVRKLHNIANSVIITDELQHINPGIINPALTTLRQMTDAYNCVVVIASATMPDVRITKGRSFGFKSMKFVHRTNRTKKCFRTSQEKWPSTLTDTHTCKKLIEKMLRYDNALAVFNTRKRARVVTEQAMTLIKEKNLNIEIYHLSRSMCALHIKEIFKEIEQKLNDGIKILVFSTQLIELGLDIDFHCVCREFGPFDMMRHAAGRANRHGKLEKGYFLIFILDDPLLEDVVLLPLESYYKAGYELTKLMFYTGKRKKSIYNAKAAREYAKRFWNAVNCDPDQVSPARKRLAYIEVENNFNVIDHSTHSVIIASWTKYIEQVEALLTNIDEQPSKKAFRETNQYCVNMYQYEIESLLEKGHIKEELEGFLVYRGPYHDIFGVSDN